MPSSTILRLSVEPLYASKLEDHVPKRLFILFILVGLVVWRIWTFSISPNMKTQEPRELPYWTPVLGHAMAFFFDFHGLLARGRRTFGNKMYMITLGSVQLYIATSQSDISAIYKNNTTLTFDEFSRGILSRIGVSTSALEKWIPETDLALPSDPRDDPKGSIHDISHIGQKLCRQQLLPGKEFDVLSAVLIKDVEESLQLQKIPQKIILSFTNMTKRVSLIGWCREVLIGAATRAFFGDCLLQIDPDLLEHFYKFDAKSWKAFFQYPQFLSNDMDNAKNGILLAMAKYFSLPKEERKGESWLIANLEAKMLKVGIDDVNDMAAIVMPLYWVINANAYRSAFWMLAYILQDQGLVAALRAEIAPVFARGTCDLGSRIEKCSLLESCYLESLRLSSSSATIRNIQQTTHMGDVTLRKGLNVMVPYCVLHRDESAWGESPNAFYAERFVKKSHLKKSPSFKPFGGGTTYCPGRFMARREVMVFVGVFLHRFDVTLAPCHGAFGTKPALPRMNIRTLAVSLMSPVAGDDLLVDVKLASMKDDVA